MREHCCEAGDRTGGATMSELTLDHLRHAALLQHDEDAAWHFRYRSTVEIDELGRLETERSEIDAIFIDGRAISLHLLHKRDKWAAKSDDIGEQAPAEYGRAHLKEVLSGRVDVIDLHTLADDEERMRESAEQRLRLNLRRPGNAGLFGRATQAVYPLIRFIVVRPRRMHKLYA